jgi:hypothetical protein
MHKLTGRQSTASRALLKWNLHDLANRVKGMQPKRIDSFEHGTVHLMPWENDELVTAFRKAGIRFKENLEVALEKEEAQREALLGTAGEGARVVLDGDQTVLSDSTADATLAPGTPRPEEDPPKS